jgi:hypothetical protein
MATRKSRGDGHSLTGKRRAASALRTTAFNTPILAGPSIEALQALCAELYQVLGTLGAPAHILDKVSAAAAGQAIPDVDLLPIGEMDFDEVRQRQGTIDEMTTLLARHLSARGGRKTSEVKAAASAANGRKGGRPRKQA